MKYLIVAKRNEPYRFIPGSTVVYCFDGWNAKARPEQITPTKLEVYVDAETEPDAIAEAMRRWVTAEGEGA